jgi:hypothetical protein
MKNRNRLDSNSYARSRAISSVCGTGAILIGCLGACHPSSTIAGKERKALESKREVWLENSMALMQDTANVFSSEALVYDGVEGRRLFCLAPWRFLYVASVGLAEMNPQLVRVVPSQYSSFLRQVGSHYTPYWFDLYELPFGREQPGAGGVRTEPNTAVRGSPWVPDMLDFAFEPGLTFQPIAMAPVGEQIAVAWFTMQEERWYQGDLLLSTFRADTLEIVAQPVKFASASSTVRLHAIADVTHDGVNDLCVAGRFASSIKVHVLDGGSLRTIREATLDKPQAGDGTPAQFLDVAESWVEPGLSSLAIPCRLSGVLASNLTAHSSIISIDLVDNSMKVQQRDTFPFGPRGYPTDVMVTGDSDFPSILLRWPLRTTGSERPCGWSVSKGYANGAGGSVTLVEGTAPCCSYENACSGPEWVADMDEDGQPDLLAATQTGSLQVHLSRDLSRPCDVGAPDGWRLLGGFYAVAMRDERVFVVLPAVRYGDESRWTICAELAVKRR